MKEKIKEACELLERVVKKYKRAPFSKKLKQLSAWQDKIYNSYKSGGSVSAMILLVGQVNTELSDNTNIKDLMENVDYIAFINLMQCIKTELITIDTQSRIEGGRAKLP